MTPGKRKAPEGTGADATTRPKDLPASIAESNDSVPQGTCSNCGGIVFYLSDGYNACRTCGVEFSPARRLAETLEDIVRVLIEYVVFPTVHERHAIALWVVQTYLLPAFDVVMFLHIFSATVESGKTRLLEVLSKIVRAPWLVSRPTAATLFRMIEERQPTLLWDEIDRVFSVKQVDAATSDLQAVVNAGHKRGAVVPRCVGEGKSLKVKDFPVFTSMAFAGINQLKLPDTVRSRSIPIGLRRRAADEPVRRWREREADAMAGPIVAKLQSLVIPLAGALREARPTIPEDLGDRAADGWEGLLAIAEAAGEDWPKRARAAARALNSLGRELDAITIGVQLLADIEATFRDQGVDRIASEDLVIALHGVEESDWGWLTKNVLARKLKPFGIKPRVVRVGERTPRGYHLEDFRDAFRRYLQKGETAATSATPQVALTRDVADVAVVSGYQGDGQGQFLEERPACPDCGGLSGHTVHCERSNT
jgi:Protein of unknown function (DUF3631)